MGYMAGLFAVVMTNMLLSGNLTEKKAQVLFQYAYVYVVCAICGLV